ncbi:hypothetical protein L218DRAFT_965613 [Marasmius fiardii PR-910]|nr:hypothetical protein L218DRAFT_965613 [Marasmius fiardii PR-910]
MLVTGVTGYIALWVARYLLERGYDVRGTVRSSSKGQQLETFKKPSKVRQTELEVWQE